MTVLECGRRGVLYELKHGIVKFQGLQESVILDEVCDWYEENAHQVPEAHWQVCAEYRRDTGRSWNPPGLRSASDDGSEELSGVI